jgi:predicted MFS family arabinose efflux permease
MVRQVVILSCAQALSQTASVLVITVGGLAGGIVATSLELATAPIATMFLGTALATFPASTWMMRVGRRAGFVTGALLGTAGGLVAALGMWHESLAVVSLGTFLVGMYQGFAQFYRFAGEEVADADFRPRAISLVLAGGVVAAILGPLLGRLGGPVFPAPFTGSFLLLAAASILAAGLLLALQIPARAADVVSGPSRPLLVIVRQPTYVVALFGAASGGGVMSLAMAATPPAMIHHGHGLADAALVIQLHVLGMFLPSFFTGSLIGRYGVLRIMLAGVGLLAAHVFMTLTGTGFYSFAPALVFLGVGWNFLYVGGTTLLTETYRSSERGRAQAANDMSIYVVGVAASFAAGALLNLTGWQALNLLLLPWLGAVALALLWLRLQRRASLAKS